MADIILMAIAVIITLVVLIIVLVTAYRAWSSRPINLELIPQNYSQSAEEIILGPYVDVISKQFPEALDNF